MINKIKNINYKELFKTVGFWFLLIIFLEFTLLPLLYPLIGDDLVVMRYSTTGHFFKWNSRLGETISTKILALWPYIFSYIIMGFSIILLILSGFYFASGRLLKLSNIKEVAISSIIVFLMAFYFHQSNVIYIINHYANYTLPLLIFILFLIPIYNFLRGNDFAVKHIKWYYFLTLCTSWSHEVVALFSFIAMAYTIFISIIDARKLPKWFFGLYIPWIIGSMLVMIGGLKRMRTSHDGLSNNSIFGFLSEQSILEAFIDIFIGYPQNTYLLTILALALFTFMFQMFLGVGSNYTQRLKNYSVIKNYRLYFLELKLFFAVPIANYIFLHSTKKMALGITNYMLFWAFVILIRLILDMDIRFKKPFKLIYFISFVILIIAVLLPIPALNIAYYAKLQRDVLDKYVQTQASIGEKNINVFQEYNPKNIFRDYGVFQNVVYYGAVTVDINDFNNRSYKDYFNYTNAPSYRAYKTNPILKSVKVNEKLKNPIMNPDGTLK